MSQFTYLFQASCYILMFTVVIFYVHDETDVVPITYQRLNFPFSSCDPVQPWDRHWPKMKRQEGRIQKARPLGFQQFSDSCVSFILLPAFPTSSWYFRFLLLDLLWLYLWNRSSDRKLIHHRLLINLLVTASTQSLSRFLSIIPPASSAVLGILAGRL